VVLVAAAEVVLRNEVVAEATDDIKQLFDENLQDKLFSFMYPVLSLQLTSSVSFFFFLPIIYVC